MSSCRSPRPNNGDADTVRTTGDLSPGSRNDGRQIWSVHSDDSLWQLYERSRVVSNALPVHGGRLRWVEFDTLPESEISPMTDSSVNIATIDCTRDDAEGLIAGLR